jgi:hypothetical protein
MKIPHEIGGRTRPSGQALGYLSDAGAVDGSAIARGLQTIAAGANRYQDQLEVENNKLKAREDKTDRFAALTDFSEFETAMATEITELKRNADPTGKGVAKQIDDLYRGREAEFLKNLPSSELQEEFRYRSSEVRGRVLGEALDFQYKAGDAFFRKGINDVYQKALTGLDPTTGGDASQLEARRAEVFEAIDSSDLTEIEKEDLKYKTSIGLESVGYKTAYKINLTKGAVNLNASIGQVIDEAAGRYGVPAETLRTIAWLESKGDPNAKNPSSSAGGLFQFIDSTARDYGLRNKFDAAESADAGARLARDNIDGLRRALGRDPTTGEVYLAHQQGLGGATALLTQPNRLATDVVGADAVRLNGGAPGMTAGQFANLWTKKAGDAGANQNLDSQPAFANVDYERRVALRADAEREFLAEQTEIAKMQAASFAASQNALLNGINEGMAGLTQIDSAFEQPWAQDFDFRKKAMDLYEKVNEEELAKSQFQDSLKTGFWDPTDTDAMKTYNLAYGDEGKNALRGMNQDYVTNTLLPVAQRIHDFPTDAMGQLEGMTRSKTQEQALFAFDTLARMEDMEPDAFAMRASEAVEKDVALYRQYRDVLPQDELMEMLGGGRTQEERTRRANLRTEAETNLAKMGSGGTTLQEKVEEVVASYGAGIGRSTPDLLASPAFARELNSDFQTYYTDFYSRTGDDELSTTLAQNAVKKLWDVTEIGGKEILMKYPPERVGYKPLAGSYDWMTRQAKLEAGAGEDEEVQLLSDEQTAQEVRDFKAGRGPAPSYMLMVKDANGVYRMRMTDGNLPYRIAFEPTADDLAQDMAIKQREVARQRLREVGAIIQGSIATGLPVPKEILDEAETLKQQFQQELPDERRQTEERNRRMEEKRGVRERLRTNPPSALREFYGDQ